MILKSPLISKGRFIYHHYKLKYIKKIIKQAVSKAEKIMRRLYTLIFLWQLERYQKDSIRVLWNRFQNIKR